MATPRDQTQELHTIFRVYTLCPRLGTLSAGKFLRCLASGIEAAKEQV